MKAFALPFVLLMLGAASAAAQTISPMAATVAPSPQKAPSLEADSPTIGSIKGDTEQPRLATRPPTPLVQK